MDKKTAEKLFNSLVEHDANFNHREFLDALVNAEIEMSSRFYDEIDGKVVIEAGDTIYRMQLRRILRNRMAFPLRMTVPKMLIEVGADVTRAYSSTILTRRIRQNPRLLRALQETKSPYSILGKIETLSFFSDGSETETKSPVLVIPGYEKSEEISKWEGRNSIRSGLGFKAYFKDLTAKYLKTA